MTLKFSDLKDFMEKLMSKNLERVKKEDLRKAIKRYWDVASEFSVDTRIDALKDEGFIKQDPEVPYVYQLNEPENDTIDKMFD